MKTGKEDSFRYLGFCFVVASVVALCISILFVSVTVAYAVGKSIGAPTATLATQSTSNVSPAPVPSAVPADLQSFHGMLTDSYCGARHARNSNRSSTECTRVCVRHGASYLLISGNTRYVVQGDKAQLNSFAGQRVTIAGELHGNSIGAHSVRAEN